MEGSLAATRIHMVRLQELVRFQSRLLSQGLSTYTDEVASARRGLQFYTGPSGIGETLKAVENGEEKCWRHKPSDRKQVDMSLNLLREGLQKASKVFLEARHEARSRLSHSKYYTKMETIG